MSDHNRIIRVALMAVAAGTLVLAAALLVWQFVAGPQGGPMALFAEPRSSIGRAAVGGPFELVDQNGQTRTPEDFRGRYMLVYFGYTYCPDVCPTSLVNMTRALDQLAAAAPEKAERITPVFITVDPERDTVEAMKAYVENFHPDLVGLTGSPAQVAEAAKAYKVFYRKVEDEGAGDYLMDHSSFIYLMGPEGDYLTHFSHQSAPTEIAGGLEKRVEG